MPRPEADRFAPPDHRSGFIAIVGRPNVGKSTLLNRLLRQKIAIVSPKPQTTRNRITGIRTLPHAQVVYIDTPGLHTPRGRLGEFMAATAIQALEAVDGVVFVADATESPAALGDGSLAPLGEVTAPVLLALNKVDRVPDKRRILPLLTAYAARHVFHELIPLSALDGTGVDRLEEAILALLPRGPAFYPADTVTDQPETFFVAETIREKLFLLTRHEVPYACAVRVQEIVERGVGKLSGGAPPTGWLPTADGRAPGRVGARSGRRSATGPTRFAGSPPGGHSPGDELSIRMHIRAVIFVEQSSQKGIVIGEGGAMLKRIGQAARRELERFFGVPVYLDLRVEVRKHWRRDGEALREFGYRLTS